MRNRSLLGPIGLSLAALLAAPVIVGAFESALDPRRLPVQLAILDVRAPLAFSIHMAASALALTLVFAVMIAPRRLHPVLGVALALAVTAGAVSAVPVALVGEATPLGKAGFLVQAGLWLSALCVGLWARWRGDLRLHRRAMTLMAALTFAPVLLRLGMALAYRAGSLTMDAYALLVWASWLLPLSLSWWGLRRGRGR